MRRSLIPFNIEFLQLTPEKLRLLRPVTSLNIYDSKHEEFHPEGLWSNTIFGPPGNPMRMTRFSYINLKVEIIHPVYFKALTEAKRLYRGIMDGSEYAVWDNGIKDFVKSTPYEGKTGYHFFVSHIHELRLSDTGTVGRQRSISLIEKYHTKCLTKYVVVLPAGLRDIVVKDGRPTMDDVNDFYRQLITMSNNITESTLEHDPSLVDNIRFKMQTVFMDLYVYINSLISGKRGLYLGKWATRKIQNTSRNVITATAPSGKVLNDPNNVKYLTTVVGLYQQMKNILPFVVREFKVGIINEIFQDPYLPVGLVDPKTLKAVELQLNSKYFDLWQTKDGINKLINQFADEDVRHSPVMIEGKYLALIYKAEEDDKLVFKIMRSIDELPMDRDKSLVSPITYGELYYIVLAKVLDKFPMIIARYPIAGTGSDIPTNVITKTTMNVEERYMLGDAWETNDAEVFPRFPIRGERWLNSQCPPVSTLAAASADRPMSVTM